ncbi:hypothetical protein ACU4GR_22510 [Methylobacterium oryzae CBMB20]
MAALTFKSDALRTQLDTPYFGCLAPAAFARTRRQCGEGRAPTPVRRPRFGDRGPSIAGARAAERPDRADAGSPP